MSGTSKNKTKKRPKDPNKLAAEIVRLSTEDEEEAVIDPVKAYLSKIGKKGGLKGGAARAKKLSKRRRKEIASHAAAARWGNADETKK